VVPSTNEAILRTQKFGTPGPLVPVIGQGTWYIDRGDRKAAIAALRRGIELGMTHIDTAEMYGDAELIIADAIAGQREELFVVSKVLPSNASRRGTITACERSLQRLNTDWLDCYLLHWRGSYPLEETVAAFEQLVASGKIRSWGVSNFDVDDLDELLDVAGEGRIACNQVLYHLKERAIEHAVLPWCERHGVAMVAYSPFGHNDFPAPNSKGGQVLQAIAEAHDATPRQVALSFLTRGPLTPPKMRLPAITCSQTARSQRSTRRFRAAQNREVSRCSEHDHGKVGTGSPKDAQTRSRPTQFLTKCYLATASAARAMACAARGRAPVHIGVPFSDLAVPARLSFSKASPDSNFCLSRLP
jgi:diketogulonate reductase-like aldo/keto reductase